MITPFVYIKTFFKISCMKKLNIFSLLFVCCVTTEAINADNIAAPKVSSSNMVCNPFILDMANLAKVSLASYLAMSSTYGPKVVTSLGSLVRGGPLVGATLIGFMGSQAAAALLNKYIFYSNTEADEMARFGTYTGAIVGTAVSIGTILATVPSVTATGATTAGIVATRTAADVLITPVIAALVFGVLAYETNCMLSE